MKRLSDPSTSETLKKLVVALCESTKRLVRRCLGCTRPPPTDVGTDLEDADAGTLDNIVVDVEMPPTGTTEILNGYKAKVGPHQPVFGHLDGHLDDDKLSTVHETMNETITWFVWWNPGVHQNILRR